MPSPAKDPIAQGDAQPMSCEEALRRSEAEFRRQVAEIEAIYRSAPIGLCVFDTRLRWVRLNQAIADINGVSIEEHIGRTPREVVPDVGEQAEAALKKILATGEPLLDFEMSGTTRSQPGVLRFWKERWVPIKDEHGQIIGISVAAEEITHRKRAEEALRASEERFRKLVDANVIGIVTADERSILSSNDEFLRIIGFTREEFSAGAVDWHALTAPEHLALDERAIAQLRERGSCDPFEKSFIRRDGTRVPVLIGASLLSAEPMSWICFVLDLTERNRAEAALAVAKADAERGREQAEQANRAKDRMIAILSHELRTPLSPAMAAISAAISDPRLPEELRHDLEIARRNLDLEVHLISDLLDVSRIAAGKLNLEKRPVDIATAITEAANVVRRDLQDKEHTLTIETPGAPYHTMGDPARLQQVFWNLLRNAIKFTPAGGRIAVRAQLAVEGGPLPMLNVQVIDSGCGIEAEMLPRLFEAFSQGSEGSSLGGLGLGLAICRSIVRLHGGSIRAESDGLGRGSTFTVCLPLIPLMSSSCQELLPHQPSASAGAATPRNLRILLVEDHPDTARMMRRLLTADGHEVLIADSLREALRALQHAQRNVDLLISDLGLPDGSGHELLHRLVQEGVSVPAIALSGYGAPSDIEASRTAGFAEHLVKPINLDQLTAAIRRVAASSIAPPSF